jgi:hypothetical protein
MPVGRDNFHANSAVQFTNNGSMLGRKGNGQCSNELHGTGRAESTSSIWTSGFSCSARSWWLIDCKTDMGSSILCVTVYRF